MTARDRPRADGEAVGLTPAFSTSRVRLYHGDCAEVLASLAPESVDAIVTDPPAGISFMGKAWDGDKGGRDQWIAWLAEIMRLAMAALKPGGHALVWSLPRTQHWTTMAVEDAGFDVRDVVQHWFGSGFPKSLDVSKAIDEAAGAVRPVVGKSARHNSTALDGASWTGPVGVPAITAPATPEAAQWSGWGTSLKPSVESWVLARKPLARGMTVAANVIAHGTGGINVDGCRVGTDDTRGRSSGTFLGGMNDDAFRPDPTVVAGSASGRWPSHLVLTHAPGCEEIGTSTTTPSRTGKRGGSGFGMFDDEKSANASGTWPGESARPVYRCAPGCPVAMLDEQSGVTQSKMAPRGMGLGYGSGSTAMDEVGRGHDDTGGASRFFATFRPDEGPQFLYTAKPARSEKDAGLDHLPLRTGGEATDREEGSAGLDNPRAGAGRGGGVRNHHPTVKPIELMRWLCRLITPPGGTVLDMFAGSGTTGVAALREGFKFIGIEREAEFVDVAAGRLAHVECVAPPEPTTPGAKRAEPIQQDLFSTLKTEAP